jgi:hypothetical protein
VTGTDFAFVQVATHPLIDYRRKPGFWISIGHCFFIALLQYVASITVNGERFCNNANSRWKLIRIFAKMFEGMINGE